MELKDLLNRLGYTPSEQILKGSCYLADGHSVVLEEGDTAQLVILDGQGDVAVELQRGARLSVVHLIGREGRRSLNICLGEGAECRMTQVLVAASDVATEVALDAPYARFDFNGLFIHTGEERGSVRVDVRHNVSDCVSRTMVKGVASQRARGAFSGLVYVAPDAQRTDSEQLNRNVIIGDARINTEPQLEIYADDVKCSHGATVGQMDAEAVLYMRQRGLSLAMAKRLQIEGFVSDVVMHSAIDELVEMLEQVLSKKFAEL